MNHRLRLVGVSTAAVVFAGSALALAASPIGGATYTGKASAKFVVSNENHETFTVAKNTKRIPKFIFWTPVSCNNGDRHDLFLNSNGQAAISVKSTGSFSHTYRFSGALVNATTQQNVSGHFTVAVTEHFASAKSAPTTVTETFSSGGGAGGVVGSIYECAGTAKFTATIT